jgi:hypothetical protein
MKTFNMRTKNTIHFVYRACCGAIGQPHIRMIIRRRLLFIIIIIITCWLKQLSATFSSSSSSSIDFDFFNDIFIDTRKRNVFHSDTTLDEFLANKTMKFNCENWNELEIGNVYQVVLSYVVIFFL